MARSSSAPRICVSTPWAASIGRLAGDGLHLRGRARHDETASKLDVEVFADPVGKRLPERQRVFQKAQAGAVGARPVFSVGGKFRILDLKVQRSGIGSGGLRAEIGSFQENDIGARLRQIPGRHQTGDPTADHQNITIPCHQCSTP
jgi:hypothetical protein